MKLKEGENLKHDFERNKTKIWNHAFDNIGFAKVVMDHFILHLAKYICIRINKRGNMHDIVVSNLSVDINAGMKHGKNCQKIQGPSRRRRNVERKFFLLNF